MTLSGDRAAPSVTMKFYHTAACLFLVSCANAIRAEPIRIEKVVGLAWYTTAGSDVQSVLKPDMDISPGSVRTDLNAVLYGSPREGSRFRMAGATTILFQSNGSAPRAGGATEPVAVFVLSQGKITMTGRAGAGSYDIESKGGKLDAGAGLCVVCSHGDAAHIYVAQGTATLYPRRGAYHLGGLKMMAQPSIAILNSDGILEIQPLSQAGPGVKNCLLSGASPGGGGSMESGLPNPVNLEGNPPVSEAQ